MSDQFICDTPKVRTFIAHVKQVLGGAGDISDKLVAIRPHFSQLMADPTWLPDEFRGMPKQGGMGAGIANWLLYKDTEGTLSFTALVLPSGSATPVHDHLAWGLVGLYVGEQDEQVYEVDSAMAQDETHAALKLVTTNHLKVGSFYELMPPSGDIHRVTTLSAEPSISLHLLTNDVGCVMRHRFMPDTGEVAPFRSGYSNLACEA